MAKLRDEDDLDLPLEVVGKELVPATTEEEELEKYGVPNGPVERNLLRHNYLRRDPWAWAREISLFVSGRGWRGYQNVIGQPSFFPGYSERMKTAVMGSQLLQKKMSDLADGRVKEERKQGLVTTNEAERREQIMAALHEVVELMTDQMICKMESRPFIRTSYYMVTQLLTRAYHQGIHVDKDEVSRLRAVAEKAAKENKSIVFLPSHKTHIDYIALQVICYRTLVQAYLDTMLRLGYNFECFIEGGRSRTGKLLAPKYGILQYIYESIDSGRCDDCLICPVSIQYDKVIEVDSYVSELLGKPKAKENLQDFLSASSVVSLKLGRVDVRFSDPWSLKDFIAEQKGRLSQVPMGADSQGGRLATLRARIIRTMGYKVLSDINAASVVMPTALVGTVLLTLRGRGVGRGQLTSKVDWLREKIHTRGGRVAHFHGLATEQVVERALEVLGPGLVGQVDGLAEPTYYAVDRFQLSFYRNMTIHLFISEALICAALYTTVKQGGSSTNQQISWDDLRSQVIFLSQLFRGEFIFQAGEGLDKNFDRTILTLVAEGTLAIIDDGVRSRRMVGLTTAERQTGREAFDFYCFLIWPFIEAAWLGAVSLISLTTPLNVDPNIVIEYNKAQTSAQLLGKTLYHQGDLSYFEAVNKEALRNAYARFEEEGIILRSKTQVINPSASSNRKHSGGPITTTILRLSPDWILSRDASTGKILPNGKLWDFTERIARSRREGKARREGATVSTRVLALAERVGTVLYADAGLEYTGDVEGAVKDGKELPVSGTAKGAKEIEEDKKKRFGRRSRL
ncbi:putative variant 1 [Phaeomoniella chlamydospora]|uniref:Putative variant 1 n=1 Tax=Phaeomoniella chlamydospora TaxID=158046 RepID=A0A0G2FP61_PHACM|nr:putative variant 1 [Phaeomoniella chlamydospora]